MMFAMRLDVDFAQDNHVIIARYIFKDAGEDVFRVLVIAAEPFLIGVHDAFRRITEAFAVRIIACPRD